MIAAVFTEIILFTYDVIALLPIFCMDVQYIQGILQAC